jgi:hypothetical protein
MKQEPPAVISLLDDDDDDDDELLFDVKPIFNKQQQPQMSVKSESKPTIVSGAASKAAAADTKPILSSNNRKMELGVWTTQLQVTDATSLAAVMGNQEEDNLFLQFGANNKENVRTEFNGNIK